MPLPAVIPLVLGKRAASLFSYDNVMGGDELRNRDYIANAQLGFTQIGDLSRILGA